MIIKKQFKFEISLSILNHLGRNLYRSFITVLGEAISNSWDANALNVWIEIDREDNFFTIRDDGDGMTPSDFQKKFLKVGYSKREDGKYTHSPRRKRPYIGAKGIGKLALLSCADTISIISKKEKSNFTGGTINNNKLDKAIKRDLKPDKYKLGKINTSLVEEYKKKVNSGTVIHFENTKEDINNTVPYLKKLIALYFRFSLVDDDFNIHVNGEPVTLDDLKDLSDNTQFVWTINKLKDPYLKNLTNILSPEINIKSKSNIRGFIASINKPRYLKIAGSEEKTGIDLFVNGRLRERDILKHLPDYSTRWVASYIYGQIHFDELDQGSNDDNFTSSRESIVSGTALYTELLNELKDEILESISDEWDKLRLKIGEDGDSENPRKTPTQRKAVGLYHLSSKDFKGSKNNNVNKWIKESEPDAEFNIPAYVKCFLSENLLRRHIDDNKLTPKACTNIDPTGKTCRDRKPDGVLSWCQYCKGEKGKQSLQEQKAVAGTAIKIRDAEDNLLMYLDYIDLANIIDNKILKNEDKPYRPHRNSVMHTSRLTAEAKTKLTSIFDNIVATIMSLMKTDDD